MKNSPLPWATLAVLWLAGFCLRITVLSSPPLALDMAGAFALGTAGIAALTMLPLVAIALGSIPSAFVIRAWGPGWTIAAGIAAMALMSSTAGG